MVCKCFCFNHFKTKKKLQLVLWHKSPMTKDCKSSKKKKSVNVPLIFILLLCLFFVVCHGTKKINSFFPLLCHIIVFSRFCCKMLTFCNQLLYINPWNAIESTTKEDPNTSSIRIHFEPQIPLSVKLYSKTLIKTYQQVSSNGNILIYKLLRICYFRPYLHKKKKKRKTIIKLLFSVPS